jgi:hypothetical protein
MKPLNTTATTAVVKNVLQRRALLHLKFKQKRKLITSRNKGEESLEVYAHIINSAGPVNLPQPCKVLN